MFNINMSHVPRAAGAEQSKRKRGFAAMDPEERRRIASLGGRAAHQSGRAHEFTSDEARAAGRKRAALRAASKAP